MPGVIDLAGKMLQKKMMRERKRREGKAKAYLLVGGDPGPGGNTVSGDPAEGVGDRGEDPGLAVDSLEVAPVMSQGVPGGVQLRNRLVTPGLGRLHSILRAVEEKGVKFSQEKR